MRKRTKARLVLTLTLATPVIAILVSVYAFYSELAASNKHQEIALSRELLKEFYQEGDTASLYRNIRMAIERCEPLYTSWGGQFNNDQINRYVGFFEDLGFYYRQGVLSLEIVDYAFGSYLIEAHENPEVQRYIKGLREKAGQHDAFVEFERLVMRVEESPRRRNEIEAARRLCQRKSQRLDRRPTHTVASFGGTWR
jgi:hypothetical protein